MWLCTQHGFYSIVRKAGDEYHIRARMKQDLVNLKALVVRDCPDASKWKIHRSVPADYRWRMVVTQPGAALAIMALAQNIDYANFKSRIHDRPDQRTKSQAYGYLWQDLHRLQNTEMTQIANKDLL